MPLENTCHMTYADTATATNPYEDMKTDSPYNTYTSKGLPPGPICNPGLDAMKAAVSPAQHDYYYYVANADGSAHIYAKTQEEQTANIKKVQAEKNAN